MPNLMPWEHYAIAQKLALEGRKVVDKISAAHQHRSDLAESFGAKINIDQADQLESITKHMDELGKKAMGIWAQGQLHATLANVPNAVASRAAEHMQGN
jgi:hypothetical protein